jgi:CRP-like cAMP-binding protein
VGEFSLLSGRPRAASVEATTELEVLGMTSTAFRSLMEEQPSISLAVMRTLAERLHDGSRSPLR